MAVAFFSPSGIANGLRDPMNGLGRRTHGAGEPVLSIAERNHRLIGHENRLREPIFLPSGHAHCLREFIRDIRKATNDPAQAPH
jgi:hypothetical protein